METSCKFVGSRGLLHSCHFKSPHPRSSCFTDTQYLYGMLNNQFDKMTIYVCTDLLPFFIQEIMNKIKHRFILLSGDSDFTFKKILPILIPLLENPFLVKWFSQNNLLSHPKIEAMPIGLDYHTILNNPASTWRMFGEGTLPTHQEEILLSIPKKPFYERKPLIYSNYTLQNDAFGDRANAHLPEHLVYKTSVMPRTLLWKDMVNYTFVLSPRGMGMDCHRTWEALCLGCIPIVTYHYSLFDDLPVLVVSDWSEITQELLETTIQVFKTRTFSYDKLTLAYWNNKIKEIYNEVS